MQPSSRPPRKRWRFLRLAAPYWRSERKWTIRGAVALLLALTLGQVGLVIWTSYWQRELFDALEDRSLQALLVQIATFAVIFLLTMLVTALHLHVKRWLQLDWRRWLTERLLDQWLSRGHHYQLLFKEGEHDNPDGRIAEDIRIVTDSAIGLGHSLIYSLLILGSFIDILYGLSGSLPIPGTDIAVPGYLVILAFLYAGGGTLLGLLLGRPLVKATNHLQTVEANLRFGLARTREHSESIALMHGEPVERQHAERLFADVGRGWNRQTLGYLGIVSFSAGYGALLPVFPILVAAPQYIAGLMSLGILMQAAMAFQRLTSALSWPVDNLGELARCRASADRVVSLYQDMLDLEQQAREPMEHRIELRPGDSGHLSLNNLCLANPDGEVLLEHLDLRVRRGERILIAGDPAVTIGLFKAVAGLWPWGSGEICLPAETPLVFLPQRPFLPEGPLRAALSYPYAISHFSDSELRHALECAGVAWLTARLDESDSWDRVLPMRAQQRLGIARVILQRPAWVFMEQATDASDANGEDCLLDVLHQELPNSTLLSISFHPGLERHFSRKLVLNRLAEPRFLNCSQPTYTLRQN